MQLSHVVLSTAPTIMVDPAQELPYQTRDYELDTDQYQQNTHCQEGAFCNVLSEEFEQTKPEQNGDAGCGKPQTQPPEGMERALTVTHE